MNLSNKTDQWGGKFEVKAKESQLNTLQSTGGENHKASVPNASASAPGSETGNYAGK